MSLKNFSSFVLFTLVTTSCTKGNPTNEVLNQTYVKAIYALPPTLDPILMNDTASLLVSNLIYEGLLRFTSDLQFEGALAESWSVDPSGKRYEFILRENIKFHDGSKITAQDVVRSLTRAVSPQSTVYKYYDCIVGAEDYFNKKAKTVNGLRAGADNKVVIELKLPFPPFLSVLAGATAKVLPAAAENPRFFISPVGAGPFKFVSKLKNKNGNDELHLEKFEQYAGTQPKISKLILRSLSEADALKQASDGSIYDLANFPLSGKEEVFKTGVDMHAPVAATWIIGLNTRKPPFNDVNIRKAFRAAVDAESFRSTFYPDAIPANGYIPKGLPGYLESNKVVDGLQKPPAHKQITVVFPEVLDRQVEMRSHLEKSLRQKGWSVSFVAMGWDKLMAGYDRKTHQAFVVSMNMDYPDTEFLIRNFESNNPDNFSGLSDARLDGWIREARSTQDRLRRGEIYKNIVTRLNDLAVTVNLFHPRAHNWVSHCVKDFVPNILADYYIDYRKIELDVNCIAKVQLL
ncbi:MAG: ABC transporter substrate-binding protein [Bdellovibrionales bacterium]